MVLRYSGGTELPQLKGEECLSLSRKCMMYLGELRKSLDLL